MFQSAGMWKEHKKITMHLCSGSNCYAICHSYFGHVSICADIFFIRRRFVYESCLCPYLLQLFMNANVCCLYIALLMAYT